MMQDQQDKIQALKQLLADAEARLSDAVVWACGFVCIELHVAVHD